MLHLLWLLPMLLPMLLAFCCRAAAMLLPMLATHAAGILAFNVGKKKQSNVCVRVCVCMDGCE